MKKWIGCAVILTAMNAQAQTLADAIKLTENEQYEKATSKFKALFAADNTNAEVCFYYAENYFYGDNTDSALILYRKGQEINPKLPLNFVGEGKVMWVDGKETEARALFDKAIAISQEKANKVKALGKASMYLEIAEALTYNEKKDLTMALAHVNTAIDLDPKNPELYILKGDILFEQDKTNATDPVNLYKQAAGMDPTSAKPVAKKAYMYYRANSKDAAVSTYTDAINLDKSYAPAYRGRAEAYYQKKMLNEAITDYKKYLELNNGNISARVRYFAFLFLAGKYDDALNEIAEVEKTNPSIVLTHRIKGYCLYEKGLYEQAKASLETYFSKQPEKKTIASDYDFLGRALYKMGQDSLAAIELVKGLKKDATKRASLAEVGAEMAKDKKFSTALVLFEAISKLSKGEMNDYYYLGTIAYRLKMHQKADTAFTQYIAFAPTYHYGYIYRGRARASLDPENKEWLAKSDYEKVVEIIEGMNEADKEKNKKDLEEAYWYLGFHYFVMKDFAVAKCFYTKISTMNTGSDKCKLATEALTKGELKTATAAESCK